MTIINKLPKRHRQRILETVTKDVVETFSECARNIILGNVPLSPNQFRYMKQHRKDIEQLGRKSASLKKKREILLKGEGAIPTAIVTAVERYFRK